MKVFGTFLLALVLHLALGWAWTLAAGVAGGFWAGRRGWLVGALGVAAGWGALIAYHLIMAGSVTRQMLDTVGGILGNLPGAAVVVASLLIGGVLGALGGFIGTQARRLVQAARRRQAVAS